MTTRSLTKSVAFSRPFLLKGVDRVLPPGDYRVVTDEELIEGLSFPVYRRVSTTLYVDRTPGRPGVKEAWRIDPEAFDAARLRDSKTL